MTVENHSAPAAAVYQRVYESDEFRALKRRRRRFVLPISTLFITWYTGYVGLAYYAPGLMAIKLFGNINVALMAGVLQVLSTLALATFYVRFTNQKIDMEAARVRRMVENAQRETSQPELFHSAKNASTEMPVSRFGGSR
jgi:uncharacterized membrane protein (DUF485 family)